MRFLKMHGCGNDYVVVDALERPLDADVAGLARAVSDRRTGIGSDGLIVIRPAESADADARMEIRNVDGSRAEICGNGLRCVGKYLYEEGIARKEHLLIDTGAGPVPLVLDVGDGGRVLRVCARLLEPRLRPEEIPADLPGERVVKHPLEVAGAIYAVTCVSVGNPHCVVVLADRDLDAVPLADLGPRFEGHPAFPRRINVQFVQVIARGTLRQRSWERGCGETRACASGAAASAVACTLLGLGDGPWRIRADGGDLKASWTPGEGVTVAGPAVESFRGEWRGAVLATQTGAS